MLSKAQREVLFLTIHQSIEEVASKVAFELTSGTVSELNYPPNYGFTTDEADSLKAIPRGPEMLSALRKVIASAAASPLFHLFCVLDGVGDPIREPADANGEVWLGVRLEPVALDANELDNHRASNEDFLHPDFYDTYWNWRRERPDPGWKLDTHEG